MLGSDGMAVQVQAFQQALGSLCAALEPDSIPLPEVGELWSRFDAIERLAAGAKCRLAARVEQSRSWAQDGDRSAADWMARSSGTTAARARAVLEASRRLRALAATDAALAQGALSGPQAEAITDAASADPAAESRLLTTAKRRGVRDLRDECARTKARVEDPDERGARLHRQRSLRTWKGADGSWNLSLRNTPGAGAEIEAALAPLHEAIFQGARLAGRHESSEAYAADAMSELVRLGVGAQGEATEGRAPSPPVGSTDDDTEEASDDGCDTSETGDTSSGGDRPGGAKRSRRPDTKIIVLISHEALKRGWVEGDERCEIAGVGPVSVSTAKGLMVDAFGAAIVTNGVDVFTVAHLGRSITAYQRSALEARGYVCEVPGCGSTRALEIDHIDDWVLTWKTQLDSLAWLCRTCHLDKTHRGWRLVGPPGQRRWVSPPGARSGPDPPSDDGARPGDGDRPTLFGDPSAA